MADKMSRKLVLQNGQTFYGAPFGAETDALCEIVFNTSMVGYQEISSDPSCVGQAVVMTYPLIGNYGMTDDDQEFRRACVGAMIVRDYNAQPSNFRYAKTLSEILEENGIPGLSGVDTRQITRILRQEGSGPCLITDSGTPEAECMARLAAYKAPHDHVQRVSCKRPWYARTSKPLLNVVAIDCGLKSDIIRRLSDRRVNVTVMPSTVTADEVLAQKPDGLFISNGPGDPKDLPHLVELVRTVRGRSPIFGICLGCELIALSYGADTYKMKTGHRGGNHPIRDLRSGLVEICAQNHGYAIDRESLAGTGLEETHDNLLDSTVEGICCEADQVYAVQYLPDNTTGPKGTDSYFDRFVGIMLENKEKEAANNA